MARLRYRVLRQVLAMAVRENRLVMNSVDGVELPPVTDVEQRFLTLEQLHRLADAAGLNRPLVYVWVAVRGGRRTALARHRSRASEHQDSRSVTEKREDGDLITCFDFDFTNFGTRRRRWRSRPVPTSRRCTTCSDTSPLG